MLRFTGAAAAVIAILPLLASPAHAADPTGYTGIVRGPDEAPIAGARLTLYPADVETQGDPAATFTTDADGRYLITGPDSDSGFKVEVSAPGHRTEWWYRAPDFRNADAVSIPSWTQVEQDVTLGTGSASVTGRITDQTGAGADATVMVRAVDSAYEAEAYTWTLGDGRYRIDNLPPGDYRISIYDNARGFQWLPGKASQEEAAIFTLADGQTLVADEQWLAPGTVRAVIGDADTGKPVARPCVSIRSTPNEVQACGRNGVVVLRDVPPGEWPVTVSGGASYFTPEEERHVVVKSGRTTKLIATLNPAAAIRTKVVDAATGSPLGSVCVHVVDATWSGQSGNMRNYCSNSADGVLEIGPFTEAQTVNLYAYQSTSPWDPPAVRYGDQWVGGAKGGTGDQRKALKIALTPKVTKTLPAIRMDPPGTITGVARDAGTGQPVRGVCAFPYSVQTATGAGKHCSNAQGQYTIDDVGPYSWPVEFAPSLSVGYAWQWSGDVADRYAATYLPVTAGATTTLDAAMVKGGVLAGTVTADGAPDDGVLVRAYNSRTRDIAGPTWDYTDNAGAFSLAGYRGGQDLWVSYWTGEKTCWYGSTTEAATPVRVTDGQTTQLAIDRDANCAPAPVPAAGLRALR
jgi:hypothetical protein